MNDIISTYTFEKKNELQTKKQIPRVKIKYTTNKNIYSIHNKLNPKIPNKSFSNIFIIMFKIKTFTNNLILPSLEFLLYKNAKNKMIFPFFKIKNIKKVNKNIINYSTFLLDHFNYNDYSLKIQGYIDINSNLFCFIKLKQKPIDSCYISNQQKNRKLWWVTHHEIKNGSLMNFKIHNSVIYIFKNYTFINDFDLQNEYVSQTLFICDSYENILHLLKNKFTENNIFKPLNICIEDAIKKKINNPFLLRVSIFSKKNITAPTEIKNLFRILPISTHFIKIDPNYIHLFKLK